MAPAAKGLKQDWGEDETYSVSLILCSVKGVVHVLIFPRPVSHPA